MIVRVHPVLHVRMGYTGVGNHSLVTRPSRPHRHASIAMLDQPHGMLQQQQGHSHGVQTRLPIDRAATATGVSHALSVKPPSDTSTAPVVKVDSSDSRCAARAAISSGRPARPTTCAPFAASSAFSSVLSGPCSGVATYPGARALTRIPAELPAGHRQRTRGTCMPVHRPPLRLRGTAARSLPPWRPSGTCTAWGRPPPC